MDSLHFNGSQFEGIMRYDARIAGEETLNKKVLYINTKEQYNVRQAENKEALYKDARTKRKQVGDRKQK